MPPPRLVVLAVSALALASCDVASEMAGDAIGAEIRTRYIAQCETVAGDMNIPAETVNAGCECSADRLSEELATGELQIDQEKIENLLRTCVQGDGADAVTTDGAS